MATELRDEDAALEVTENYAREVKDRILPNFHRLYILIDTITAIKKRALQMTIDGTLTPEIAKQMEREEKGPRQEFETIRNAFFVISGRDPLEVIIACMPPELGRILMRYFAPLSPQL